MSLGEKIFRLRTSKGLSQDELAEVLNVSRQTISNWENDKVTIDIFKTAELCAFFNITVDDMLSEDAVFAPYDRRATTDVSTVSTNIPSAHKTKNISLWISLTLSICCFVCFLISIVCAFAFSADTVTSTITSTGSSVWIILAVVCFISSLISLCAVIKLYKKSQK